MSLLLGAPGGATRRCFSYLHSRCFEEPQALRCQWDRPDAAIIDPRAGDVSATPQR